MFTILKLTKEKNTKNKLMLNVTNNVKLPEGGVILFPLVSSFFSLGGDSASKGSAFHDCQLPASRAFNNLWKAK